MSTAGRLYDIVLDQLRTAERRVVELEAALSRECTGQGDMADDLGLDHQRSYREQCLEMRADKERLDKLQVVADSGVVNITFEMDGGNILDFCFMGDEKETVLREQKDVRSAIDAMQVKV